jgi:hypothetical protein
VAPIDALREHGRIPGEVGGLGGGWSGGLIVAQVALSLLLVVGAGLFVQTFERLALAPLGLDRDRILMTTITAPTVPAADRNRVYHQLVKAVAPSLASPPGARSTRQSPGSWSATSSSPMPASRRGGCGGRVAIHGHHPGRSRRWHRFAPAATSRSAMGKTRRV